MATLISNALPIFQTYILPPLRRESTPTFLSGHTSTISCSRCHADLASTSQIISKGFTGRHGRAYLVSHAPGAQDLPNTRAHKATPRNLVTGQHIVADISCTVCGSGLGWKYVSAEDEAQRYKVGNFILESRRTTVSKGWEGEGEWDPL